jgi:hypothetical protein
MAKSLFILLLTIAAFSAKAQEWQWVKHISSENSIDAKSIAIDAQGNTYVTGVFGKSITFDGVVITSEQAINGFIAKYNNNGDLIWAKKLGEGNTFQSKDIVADDAGNVYVTGHFRETVTIGTITLTGSASLGAFITKLDTDGNVLWAKQISSDDDLSNGSLALDNNGHLYIAGGFFKSVKFGDTTITSAKDETIFIAKYTVDGDHLWAKKVGGLMSNVLGISVDHEGNIYATGSFYFAVTFGDFNFLNYKGNFHMDLFLVKLDTNGNVAWAKQAGFRSGDDIGVATAVDSEGNCYVTGLFTGSATFGSNTISGSPGRNPFLAKYDPAGSLQWVKKQESTGEAAGLSIGMNSQNVYLAGYFDNTVTLNKTVLVSQGSLDMHIAKYDKDGNILGVVSAGGTGFDALSKIHVNESGQVHFTGGIGAPVAFDDTTLKQGLVVGKLNVIPPLTPTPTILTEKLATGNLCAGSVIEVAFTTNGEFKPGNSFQVQLSNSSGVFTNPGLIIGSGSSSPVTATIPSDIPLSAGYKLRVVATSPKVYGTSSNSSITIGSLPVVTASVATKAIVSGTSTNLFAKGADTYIWSPNTGLSSASIASPIVSPAVTTTYTVTGFKDGCSSSASVTVYVEPEPSAGETFEWASVQVGDETHGSHAQATVSDNEGNTYVAGTFWNSITLGSFTLSEPGESYFLAKYNGDGDIVWAKKFTSPYSAMVVVHELAVDQKGGVYIVGWYSNSILLDTITLTAGKEGSGSFIAKFDNNGNTVWANSVHQEFRNIAVTPEGELYLAGSFMNATFNGITVTRDKRSLLLIKYDVNGELVWYKSSLGSSSIYTYTIGLAVDSDGSPYVVGLFGRGTFEVDAFTLMNDEPGFYYEHYKPFFIKYNTNGEVQFSQQLGRNVNNLITSGVSEIIISPNDEIYTTAGQALLKFKKNGDQVWVTEVDNIGQHHLAVDEDGSVYISGRFSVARFFGSKQVITDKDYTGLFVAKYNSKGNAVWAEKAQMTAKDYSSFSHSGISVDKNKNIFVVGHHSLSPEHVFVFGCHKIEGYTNSYFVAKLAHQEQAPGKIQTGNIDSGILCAGATYAVPFTSTVKDEGCTTYTVVLSDSQGSFNWPQVIGTGSVSPISVTIPSNIIGSSFYRIKVISSGPSVTGIDNSINITITPKPALYIYESKAAQCPGTTGITYYAATSGEVTSFNWTVPDGWVITEGQGTDRIKVTSGSSDGSVSVTAQDMCGNEVSKDKAVTVAKIFAPKVRFVSNTVCGSGSAFIYPDEVPYVSKYKLYASETSNNVISEKAPDSRGSAIESPVIDVTTTFYLSILFSSGCEGPRTPVIITVKAPLEVTAGLAEKYCINAHGFFLKGMSPENGYWSGKGVTSYGFFDPAVAGPGTHELKYQVSQNGCTGSGTKTITVMPSPQVTLNAYSPLCRSVFNYILTGGLPAGGVYSGIGVRDGIFNPIDSVDHVDIAYTYTDGAGCSATVWQRIELTTCTGITESKLAAKLVVYPNPTKDNLNIELPLTFASAITLKLSDMKGQSLYEQNYPRAHGEFKQTLSLKSRAKGMYLLQLILDDGVITKRIVID